MLAYIAIFILVCFVFFLYKGIVYRKAEQEKLRKRIRKNWGRLIKRKYSGEELKKLKRSCENIGEAEAVDDITWNDFDMDGIFGVLNNTYSSIGEERLYSVLRVPEYSEEILKKRDKNADIFVNNNEAAFELQEKYDKLGKVKKISVLSLKNIFSTMKEGSNVRHYLEIILLVASLCILFINPVIGLIFNVVMLIVCIGDYFSAKNDFGENFIFIKYLSDVLKVSGDIEKSEVPGMENDFARLKEINKELKPVRKNLFLISTGNEGSPGEVIMVYVRMIFHVDIIKYNRLLKTIREKSEVISEMFELLGDIEVAMATASFRCACTTSKPVFGDTLKIDMEEAYHPMIKNPVSNSLNEKKSILITGSNASGKSTFLRTVGINQILSQTIYTAAAKSFKTTFFNIKSSMALSDNLEKNESYYMAEIKSIKRILDKTKEDRPVLCFVDEVLRGTNTIERIAASSYILDALCKNNCICLAATHDIELTDILKDSYSNYHFTETVTDDNIEFSYKLNKGKATSRNAIKLLEIIGFDKNITEMAKQMTDTFEKEKKWQLIKK